MTDAGAACDRAHGGAEAGSLSAALRPSANILFEEDRAPGQWEPFETESKPLAAFAQLFAASAAVQTERAAAPAEGETDSQSTAGAFAAADLIWPVQNHAAEELIRSHAQIIQEMETRHRQEIDETQARLTKDFSRQFASAAGSFETQIAAELNAGLSRLLAPFLTEQAKRASVAAIVEELLSLILSGKLSPIKLSGPTPLIGEVRLAMGNAADRIVFADVLSPELVIEIDTHIISTRLSEWSDCLRAALS
jgi:hypothetical protein